VRTVNIRPGLRIVSLPALIAKARAHTEACLREHGRVMPTLLAPIGSELIIHVAEQSDTEEDKDRFVLECRLLLVASEAKLCAMVLESWITMAHAHKLPDSPPSVSPDRREVITVSAESRTEKGFLIFPIQRTSLGIFRELGDNTAPAGITTSGRFAQVLPPKVPGARVARMARLSLERMGIRLESPDAGFSAN
jgi:hypothetical protein